MRIRKRTIKAYDVIAKAIELLGPKGQYWMTGDEHAKQGDEGQDTYCMVGALDEAVAVLGANEETEQKAFVMVGEQVIKERSWHSYDLSTVTRDEYTGQFTSNLDEAAGRARDLIPDFNDALPNEETTYETRDGAEHFKHSRRPKGFTQVKKVFCKALRKTVAKNI